VQRPTSGCQRRSGSRRSKKGYKDGWEDAERALSLRKGQISDGFAQQLQDLNFTLSQARVSVRREMSTLLKGVLDTMLPGALPQLLGPQILSELEDIAQSISDVSLKVIVAPEQKDLVASMLREAPGVTAAVEAEDNQPVNTALIKFASSEREIDLQSALSEVAETIETYFDDPLAQEERAHG